MSANGEVEVAVKAEGVEDATGEFAPDAAGVGGGRDGGGFDGGKASKVLALLGAVLAVFEDVLKVVGVVSKVLQAFVAPLAVMLMRLLQPLLRIMLTKILPLWLDFMQSENDSILAALKLALSPLYSPLYLLYTAMVAVYNWLASALQSVLKASLMMLEGPLEGAEDYLQSLPRRLWSYLKRLPGMIGSAVASSIPDFGLGGGGDGGGGGLPGWLRDALDRGGGGGSGGTNVTISGGLSAFIDEISDNSGIDWP